jgi:PIN domain
MPPLSPDQIRAILPIRAVVDACVFPRTKQWLGPLLDAARNGYVDLIWSPLIIAESNRVLTWLWLKRHGNDFSDRAWEQCSIDAKRMFARLTPYFHVVDDCPPAASLWNNPSDAWDIPIWTAAKRSDASFIVTDNLSDGPPLNAEGYREFDDVNFVHPSDLLAVLDYLANIVEGDELATLPDEPTATEDDLPAVFRGFLRSLSP